MHWRKAWIIASFLFLIDIVGLRLPLADARIVVGVSTVNVAFLPIYLTQDRGFFRDEGLDVLVVMFNAGATNLQALIGGDVQIMGSAFVETLGGRAAGFDVKNFWGVCNIMPFQLYSQPDFKSMQQAKGKRFAISRFGSLTDFLTRATLRHFNLSEKEVTILQIGNESERLAALRVLPDGAIDGVVEEVRVRPLEAALHLGEEEPRQVHPGEHGGATVVDQQDDLDAVEQIAPEGELDLAAVSGALVDRLVQVELVARSRGDHALQGRQGLRHV